MALAKTIVIKPTMDCNLRCGYCYEFLRNGTSYCKDIMDIKQLTGIIYRTARLFPDSKILWMFHGGEPLLKGVSFFEEVANCIRNVNEEFPVQYKIALQTNATLLNDDFINVLEKNADLLSERIVSVSIDGSQEINDITRHYINGVSSFEKLISSINRIRKSKLSFSTISVIGTHNINRSQELFHFLRKSGSNLCKFVPCYNSDSRGTPEKYGIRPMEFAHFMCEMFDLWMHNLPSETKESRMVIEPIASIICNASKSVVTWCEYREEKCSNFTCIYPNGEMWLCDNFMHETMKNTAYVKNIFEVSDEQLKEILLTPTCVCQFDDFYKKSMKNCYECDIFDYCKGGCIPTRYEMLKKSSELHKEYCEAKRVLINHIKKGIELALS